MEKTCTRCGVVARGEQEDIDAVFHPRRKKNGYRGNRQICRTCNAEAVKDWREANPAKWAEIQARYRKNRKERAA
jgi:hypothetical protein